MSLDFPTVLVLATLSSGLIWGADRLWFAPRRRAAAGEGAPAKEPVVVEYARSFFPVLLAVLVLRSFVVEPFRIPSGSMMPTLLVGDFILVNKYAYGLRWPVLDSKFLDLGEPERGDVAVFRFPQDPRTDYIKRIVAVPGDEIHYRGKTLYINGEAQPQTPLGRYTGVGSSTALKGTIEAVEDLTGVEHRILVDPTRPDFPPMCREFAYGPIEVPPGYYFAMGDNRDNSNDSRCWGLVPEANLVGKAFAIWMHWDGQRDGLPIDWGRIGNGID
ncbi:signal peptidase I [Thiococcus pfennigii]|uniref:signal peptidase I n=1 Tax=Thiococcus pfennigii TaxID=1057 RepID=UPI001904EBE9|nr:signal peptidase I [Thiococcus pfennigii]MBK1701849.1 signal peptidase I [Thiococcus pfennigii]MBK1731249.1 signal peptidase I [Thiococcus pfennigii]